MGAIVGMNADTEMVSRGVVQDFFFLSRFLVVLFSSLVSD